MQLEQSFELPGTPDQTWAAFKNIELLVDCLPGASLTGPPVDGEMPLRFDVKLGPISAGFAGSGRVTFDDASERGRFEGAAADKRTGSRVKGVAEFSVLPLEERSLVEVNVDYSLSGSLAQFSRGGIVRELAAALTNQFADNLSKRLQASAGGADGTAASDDPAAKPRSPSSNAPLSGTALVGQALKAKWKRMRD